MFSFMSVLCWQHLNLTNSSKTEPARNLYCVSWRLTKISRTMGFSGKTNPRTKLLASTLRKEALSSLWSTSSHSLKYSKTSRSTSSTVALRKQYGGVLVYNKLSTSSPPIVCSKHVQRRLATFWCSRSSKSVQRRDMNNSSASSGLVKRFHSMP